MTRRPFRVAVAGTHSTGKTSFLLDLRERLSALGAVVEYVHDGALSARELGFPILAEHTFESTAWLVARAMQLEAEATLRADVILIDRPVPDALGYLVAALRHTGRSIPAARLRALRSICAAWAPEYDMVFRTVLDADVPLGEGRDGDAAFRTRAHEAVAEIVDELVPHRTLLTAGGGEAAAAIVVAAFERHVASLRRT